MLESNKKMSAICILQVLRDYSDKNHLLKQKDIIEKLDHHYGLSLDRKSVSATLDSLIDVGYDIQKTGKGSYLNNRELEQSEVSFLIDAIFSSKSIDSKNCQRLAKKLSSFLSEHQRRSYNYIYKADDVVRTNNQQLFSNIDLLNKAIEEGKQVQLCYNRFYFDKAKNEQKKNTPKIVNPYFMVNNQGRYFLVCNYDHYNDISNYKLDLISNIKILDTNAKPITKVEGCANGIDKAKYANENIYMFHNNPVDATLKIDNEYAVNYVVDWFGNKVRFYSKNGSVYVDVHANEESLVFWCLQYGQDIELVEPLTTRAKIQQALSKINKRYN